ncbi:hypothetical protein X747_20065 [Mesorhizobium sp. LNJC384A00]|nr:hypothetical protein X771_12170 [Mesorhizobium sp. LSJC277A00]ESY40485.1 hypothetical protein X747_20065 [Mesorhizobium sp. LNJC384A00]
MVIMFFRGMAVFACLLLQHAGHAIGSRQG